MTVSLMLAARELVRFYRQRSRIVGAIGTPVIFWAFIGSGVGNSYRSELVPESMTYLEFLFPGTLVLIILFASIFSNISVIDDKGAGFLQSVLVAPASRMSIVFGKILGGSLLATSQALIFLVLAPVSGVPLGWGSAFFVLLISFLISICVSTIGFIFAWRLDSVQGFHAVMNLLLFPMWLLCGALFPFSGAPRVIQYAGMLNPLTYGLSLLRTAFYGQSMRGDPSAKISLSVLMLVIVVSLGLAVIQVNKEFRGKT